MGRVTLPQLRRGIRALGLVGRPVCVHSSLRSFGEVEGGANTVVEAFLLEGCTLLVPAFSWMFSAAPRATPGPPRNAFDYKRISRAAGDSGTYTTSSLEIDPSMGAIPRAVVERPGRSRGAHPLSSFAAVAPDADLLVGTQAPLNVFAPLTVLAELGGAALLVGVGLNSMTLLHLAEARAGREPFRRWANDPRGEVIEAQTGGCSGGFASFDPVLAPLAQETVVGASRWRAYPTRQAVEEATRAIRADPLMTHCGDPGCERCRDAIAGGPLVA